MTQESKTGLIGAGVLAALGVLLFGLILPGVGKLRDMSNRTQCQNYLKTLGLACQTYAEVYQHLPPGTQPLPGVPPERRLSWLYPVMPMICNDPTFRLFNDKQPADHPTNVAAGRQANYWYLCPGHPQYEAYRQAIWSGSPTPTNDTHYVGIAGTGADAATLPADHPRSGAFGYDRTRSLKDGLPDGLATTLLILEVGRDPGPWAVGGPGTVRGVDADARPPFGPAQAFGGFHPCTTTWFRRTDFGSNAAMADGGVRFLPSHTDPAVLAAMATAGGNDPVPIE